MLYVLILPQYSHCGEKLSCYPWKNLKQFISKAKYWGLERVFGGGPKLSCYGTGLTANKLSLNINKTNYIVFRTPHSKPPDQHTLQMRKKDIKRIASLKFLGIIVHEHLSWKPHMEALLKKIRITCSVVNKIRNHLSQRILLLLYKFNDKKPSSVLHYHLV